MVRARFTFWRGQVSAFFFSNVRRRRQHAAFPHRCECAFRSAGRWPDLLLCPRHWAAISNDSVGARVVKGRRGEEDSGRQAGGGNTAEDRGYRRVRVAAVCQSCRGVRTLLGRLDRCFAVSRRQTPAFCHAGVRRCTMLQSTATPKRSRSCFCEAPTRTRSIAHRANVGAMGDASLC